eukprot:337078-Pyramimonas_sp.AAC.1
MAYMRARYRTGSPALSRDFVVSSGPRDPRVDPWLPAGGGTKGGPRGGSEGGDYIKSSKSGCPALNA